MSVAAAIRLTRPPRAAARRAPADPAVRLTREYRRCAASLWREINRHEAACGCGVPGAQRCDLDVQLVALWCETVGMAEALEWLVLGQPPKGYKYSQYPGVWARDWLPGPWAPGGRP